MKKALLINFNVWAVDRLTQEGLVVENKLTYWNNGSDDIIPDKDTSFVFIDGTFEDQHSSSLHAGNHKYFEEYVKSGGIVVSFINNCQQFHLKNLIGLPLYFNIRNVGGNKRSIKPSESVFLPIFAKFGNKIQYSLSLLNIRSNEDFTTSPSLPDEYELLAYQPDISGTVALKYQLGRGFYLYLPHFGNENMDVIKQLVNDILPNNFPELFEQPVETWTKKEEYYLPEILQVNKKISDLEKKYKIDKALLEKEYKDVWTEKQEPYLKLITTQSDKLKNAVASFFTEMGYYVIDVDEYFRERKKENSLDEDLWLLNDKLDDYEEIMKQEDLKIVEVKGIKNIPKDDDVTAITKYVRKRMRETKNSQIKGLFVVNHQMGIPANDRKGAFRDMLVDNAKDAGELLISTNVLFKIVNAYKNKKIEADAIRKLIDNTSGQLIF